MTNNIPEGAIEILVALHMHGYQAYLVGGCVRDCLMGRQPHDWDICTDASPAEMKYVFRDYKIIETGLQHGTLTVVSCGDSYEVTTFRIDGQYTDGRHPDNVSFTQNLVYDLARRDFTINAIAMRIDGSIIDPFNGSGDIKGRVIRSVGDPKRRFEEDALRILRAVRFASTLEFDIHYDTAIAMMTRCLGLKNISEERVANELRKTLTGRCPGSVLNKYSFVLWVFWPEVMDCVGFDQQNPYHIYDVWTHITTALDYGACMTDDIVVRLALLLHDIAKPRCMTVDDRGGHFYGHPPVCAAMADDMLRRLKFDNATREAVVELIEHHDATVVPSEKNIRRWLNKIGEQQLRRLLMIKIADASAHNRANVGTRIHDAAEAMVIFERAISDQVCFSLKDLAVSGKDVLAAGLQPGPKVGEILRDILELVINGDSQNDREELLGLVKTMVESQK